MKNLQKLISGVLCMVLFLSMFTQFNVTVLAADNPVELNNVGNTSGDFNYKLNNNGEAMITAYIGSDTKITIPDTIDNYKVTSIGEYVFSEFHKVADITSITIPKSVTDIGNFAFYECKKLTSINIPENVTYIGMYAFSRFKNLTSINIPENVTYIREYAFAYCEKLTSINISEGVTYIGDNAFSGCKNLTSINIPKSVTAIRDGVFSSCTSLSNINIPDSITDIGMYAFSGCKNLTSVNIPDSVIVIGNEAFYCCTSLTNINIPEGVTAIGESAFFNCPGLTSINIPQSVKIIEIPSFVSCNNLISITVDSENTVFDIRNNCNAIIKDNKLVVGCKNTIIPEGVTAIGESAFWGCRELRSIKIPYSVIEIEPFAFILCNKLKSITIPKTVKYFGEAAISPSTKDELIIYCPKNSSAQKYALENNIPYSNNFSKYTQKITGTNKYNLKKSAKPFTLDAKLMIGNGKLSYISSNPAVATVSKKGLVTIKKAGKAKITVTSSKTTGYKKCTFTINLKIK